MSISCEECGKGFGQLKNLTKHYRIFHQLERGKTRNFKCLNCPRSFFRVAQLRQHLELVHEVEMECKRLIFLSMDDFLSWKSAMEKETGSSYFQTSGSKKLVDCTEVIHYNCHRSGTFISKGKGIRHLKSKGSCRSGYQCTSEIVCKRFPNSEVSADFHSYHHCHDTEIDHLRLPQDDRIAIAEKLKKGMSPTAILKSVRGNSLMNTLERVRLLTLKDIRNISKGLKLNTHKDDVNNEDVEVRTTEDCQVLSQPKQKNCTNNESDEDLRKILEHKLEYINSLIHNYELTANSADRLIAYLDEIATFLHDQCDGEQGKLNPKNEHFDTETELTQPLPFFIKRSADENITVCNYELDHTYAKK